MSDSTHNKHKKIFTIGLVVFFVLLGVTAASGSSLIREPRVSESSSANDSKLGRELGVSTSNSGYNVKINSSTRVKDGGALTSKENIEKVNITFTNDTEIIQQISPLLQFAIKDDKGNYYKIDASIAGSMLGGPLEPRTSMTGDLNFVIPSNSTTLTLVFVGEEGNKPSEVSLQ